MNVLEQKMMAAYDHGFAVLNWTDLRRDLNAEKLRDTRLQNQISLRWQDLTSRYRDLPKQVKFKMHRWKKSGECVLMCEPSWSEEITPMEFEVTAEEE